MGVGPAGHRVRLCSRHFRQRAQHESILKYLRARQLDPLHCPAELAVGENIDIQLAGAEAAGGGDPRLGAFTVVTAGYTAGSLSGVIGVIGPTRMPYDKVIALVGHTSQLVSELLC